MLIKMYERFGKRIFEQKFGTEIAKIIIDKHEKCILDFENVESINTAFWNAMLSEIIKINKKPNNLISIKNANETIKNTLAISLELLKYNENSQ